MQQRIPRFLLVILGLLMAAAPVPAAPTATASQSAEYTVTVIPYYAPEKLWVKFEPFVAYLRESTRLPWELKLYPNHASLLDALCSGEVSYALLGPVPLGRVLDRCNAGVVAVALGKDGRPFYRSMVLTGDPAVTALGALKGKRLAIFKGSTAAHIFPLKMLKDAGVSEAEIIPVSFESQDRIMNALLSREIAGAGVKDALYRTFQRERLAVLATSEPLPGFAFAAAPGATERSRRSFIKALLALKPAAKDRRRVESWDDEIRNGFIEPPAGFRASVLNVLTVYNEIISEAR